MPATPLFDPNGFFRERPNPSLRLPLVILTVTSIVFTVVYEGVLFGPWNMWTLLLAYPDLILINFAIGVLSGLISFGFYWIGVAVFFYVISLVFEEASGFRRVFAYVGWSLLPNLLGIVLFGLVFMSLFPKGIIAAEGSHFFVEAFRAQAGVLLRAIQVGSVLLTVWVAYILVYALVHGRELSRREASIVVGVPLVLQYIIWFIFQYYYFPDLLTAVT